jgi:hypothetical protein
MRRGLAHILAAATAALAVAALSFAAADSMLSGAIAATRNTAASPRSSSQPLWSPAPGGRPWSPAIPCAAGAEHSRARGLVPCGVPAEGLEWTEQPLSDPKAPFVHPMADGLTESDLTNVDGDEDRIGKLAHVVVKCLFSNMATSTFDLSVACREIARHISATCAPLPPTELYRLVVRGRQRP